MKSQNHISRIKISFVAMLSLGFYLGYCQNNAGSISMENRYMIEQGSSYLRVGGQVMGIPGLHGTFGKVRGTFFYDEKDPTKTSVSVSISNGMFAAISPQGIQIVPDSILTGKSFFNSNEYPLSWFQSKSVKQNEDKSLSMIGNLSIKGISREIEILVDKASGVSIDKNGVKRVKIHGTASINRKDFMLEAPQPMEQMLGPSIEIELIITGFGWTIDNVKNRFSKPEEDGSENFVSALYAIAKEKGAKRALKTYSSAKKTSPEKITKNTLANAGWYLMKDGYPSEAIELYKKGISDYPDNHNTKMRMGDAYVIAGDNGQAIATYKEALNYYPNFHHIAEMLKLLDETYR